MNKLTKKSAFSFLVNPSYIIGFLSLTCAVFCGVAFSGKVYKWIDENGAIQYGDHPPYQSESTQELKLRVPVEPDKNGIKESQTQETVRKQLEVYDEIRREKKEKERKEKEKHKKIEGECFRLKAQLIDFKRGGAIWYRLDQDGNRVYTTNEQLEHQIKKLEEVINKHCR